MDMEKLLEQLKRLAEVSPSVWWEALDAALEEIALQLHGHLKEDKNGRKYLVGGYTEYGAHSEKRLGGEPLYHYLGMVVGKLYDGSCEWKTENSLAEQLKKMAEEVIDDSVKAYRHEQKEESLLGTPVGLDVEWIGDEDGDLSTSVEMTEGVLGVTDASDSEKSRHMKWEAICEAADGDTELEAFVQVTGECQSMKEVNERLSLKSDDRDRLLKRLKRRVGKKVTQRVKDVAGEKSLENSVGFGVKFEQYVCEKIKFRV